MCVLMTGWLLSVDARSEVVGLEERENTPSPWTLDISLSQEYRVRYASAPLSVTGPLGEPVAPRGARDQDLRLTLDALSTGWGGHFVSQVSAALWKDLDGGAASGDPAYLGDAQDLAQPLVVLYSLTAEWRRQGPLEYARVGRQQATHGLPVTFDGGALDLRFWDRDATLFGFGGRTVHFFESSPGLFENWLAGGGVGLRLAEGMAVEVDSRFLHERILAMGGDLGRWVNTHSYGLTLNVFSETVQGKAYVRGLNRVASHTGGALRWQSARLRFGIDAMGATQLVTLGEVAESENPYFSMLGASLPHVRGRAEVWKEFAAGGEGLLVVYLGGRLRALLRDEPTRYNRNAAAAYFRVEVRDVLTKGLFASALGEWNAQSTGGFSDGFLTLGGSVGFASRKLKAETGTYFQRFKIAYYQDVEELQDVRTVFVVAGYRVVPRVEVRGRYVLELLDRQIHAGYVTVRQEF